MKLPCEECGGKCCTAPAFTRREFKNVRKKYGVPRGTVLVDFENQVGILKGKGVSPILDNGVCAYLKKGRCSIYEDRPLVCRKYGVIPELPCMYLYPDEALKKVKEMMTRLL